ncbi:MULTISPECIES: type II CAAX endopeptidase family protein [unclassified Streptomyces]|uniref:CPBP family intramembrane glutamic endopeptidase n=1 Tax=Streptomyces TaxID=1883 RepID=UPI0001C1B611|nr:MULTISPECIES: type II CAAX endopeptidase family protein [unclassified Streptomyces]AEN11057.1 Abortive infection protein [Streptomyces sp. SirexAA-E]MYR65913.1 CPBP family intramembrane metalloprotease [Streptomyces sp. SID4939]MYS04384.1 CPBP family intramembrane metalloprotease [Streptomyces sp. SID4940]MYT63676.1 CPBP family intramembrane metalloprotease [Streptomyces sp. SID8357]MYT85926.1 CPBP family intramembrane metalloprotease [Streptomyces sp. SID8360]
MRVVWQLVAVVAVTMIGGNAVSALDGGPWLTLGLGLVTAVVSVLVYRWVVGRTERRPVTELARKGAWSAIGRGAVIGVAMFGAVMANIAFLGYYDVHGLGSVTGAVGLVGFMAAAAFTEEVMFRGVLFRIIEEYTGTWIALISTGLVFGLMHLANPHADLWGAIAIAIEAGGMLGAAYVATRSLWLPIGLHFGWNFAAAGIFSTEVSGNDTPQGLLDTTTSGPTPITGGAFGPEGSLYSVLFGVLVTLGFLWLAHRRGNLVPRRRADRTEAATTLVR